VELARAVVLFATSCAGTATLGCGPSNPDAGPATATSASTESGAPDHDVPYDLAGPYGPCNDACARPEFDCSECGATGGCADPVHEGPFTVCSVLCETAEDCPAPPIPGELLCEYGGCYLGCEANPCPEGQTCVRFVKPTDRPVCMYVG